MQGALLSAILGYLLGSIPFGLLVARSRGIDIRLHGSGNIGATNVLRTLGKKWGILVFALDALKGVAAVLLAKTVLARALPGAETAALAPEHLGILGGLACVLGHNFPVWLGFKGGKGVATTAGVLVALLPVAAGVALVVWVAVFFLTRYVSAASIAAGVAIPPTVWVVERRANALFWFGVAAAGLAIWRHRSNIRRLLAGTESRFERKKR